MAFPATCQLTTSRRRNPDCVKRLPRKLQHHNEMTLFSHGVALLMLGLRGCDVGGRTAVGRLGLLARQHNRSRRPDFRHVYFADDPAGAVHEFFWPLRLHRHTGHHALTLAKVINCTAIISSLQAHPRATNCNDGTSAPTLSEMGARFPDAIGSS